MRVREFPDPEELIDVLGTTEGANDVGREQEAARMKELGSVVTLGKSAPVTITVCNETGGIAGGEAPDTDAIVSTIVVLT